MTEWDKIYTTKAKKIKSFFTFPLFMATYFPISVTALFKKVEWKQIKHSVSVSIDDMDRKGKQDGKPEWKTTPRTKADRGAVLI